MDSIRFDGYTVRRATEADIPGFLALHRTVFGTWPASTARATFDWKYGDNPFFDGLPVIVAEYDGETVGAKGHFGLEMAVGDETLLGVQTGDLMVHPDHRRKGIHGRMVELDTALYDEGEQLFFGFPGKAATEGYLDAGRRRVENPLYVRPMAASPAGDSSRPSRWLQTVGLAGYSVYTGVIDRLFASGDRYGVERLSEPPVELLAALYGRDVPDGIHARRDEEFYAWRLADPLHDFTTYLARRGGDVSACAVVSERDDHVFVRDVLPFGASPGAVEAIFDAVVADFSDRASLSAWCPASLDPGVFFRSGFITSGVLPRFPYSTDLVVRRVADDWEVAGVRIDDPDSWAIQLLERDY